MFSCTDPAQNQLMQDKCIQMESGNPPWLSPDIILTSSLGEIDKARKGQLNTVTLRARRTVRNLDGSACVLPTNVRFQLWVGLPSLNPPISSAVQVQGFIPYESLPTTIFNVINPNNENELIGQVSKTWTAEELLPPHSSDTATDLHRCLIARCYPSNVSPPDAQFCVVEDPHVVQRNIAIVKVQMGMMFNFPIQTNGINPELVEAATIRVFADRVPSTAVVNAILPSLKQFQGFRQIAEVAPEKFALQVPENLAPVIRDNSRLDNLAPITPGDIPFRDTWRYVFRDRGNFEHFRDVVFNPNVVLQEAIAVRKFNSALNVRDLRVVAGLQVAPNLQITPRLEQLVERAAPTFEADIKLLPSQIADFTFTANLPEASQPGDAHIFHVMHIDERQQVIGGLTIVAVVT